jgi:hypothetical protein
MKKVILTLLLLTFALFGCKKDHLLNDSNDYLIFGHFFGECGGPNCIEIFKLSHTELMEDTLDHYPSSTDFYEGQYVLLSQSKFDQTKDLTTFFPTPLLNETTKVIGQPDAGDWGGLYIEYHINGIRKFWLIDLMKTNVPANYYAFIDKVTEKIAQLQ